MKFNKLITKFLSLVCFAIAVLGISSAANAQNAAIGIDPTRIQVIIPAGSEKTVGTTVSYSREAPDVEIPLARLVTRLEDWTISETGNVKFAPASSLERSAASWVTASSSEFTLSPDTQRTIRFTISVPKGTPPGDYYFAAYVESRDAPPPPKEGEKRIVISFRHYLMVYVMVPGLTQEGELQSLETKVENGRPVVIPKLANKGNSHIRPIQTIEILNADDKVVFASDPSEARVLLGGHFWQIPYTLTTDLPPGKYSLKYQVDFLDKKTLQVGKTTFEITDADVAARKKIDNQTIAEKDN